ncbi:MAG: phosphate ABC transporter ATP-binding protein [archaeon]|nr:phosphate ABC transporter ATP-binding protein [archaeon]MCP8313563.1 phosphate ABC transporter ATP-binding protein [archaeon]
MIDKIESKGLDAWYDEKHVVKNVSLRIKSNQVTAVIGPSGCGKSTLIRCFNRMHELVPGARLSGKVLLDGEDIYADFVDPVDIRRRVGMVFQKPNPFPTMSIFDNVATGLTLNGVKDKKKIREMVERSLMMVTLLDEVKDRLNESGASLSGGQQQRLCIARALAVEPEVILLDEPCSALDPNATSKIEELIVNLKENYTIVVVTHNMQQAARVSDFTAFMYLGEIIEYGETARIFKYPEKELTERYITGRFG